MNVARLIIDPPQPGDWNMAVDEALLESAARGVTTLRFYQWSEPTLSLGYFQAYRQRELHAASRDCLCVRRTSGGGAILHDRELTYSFATPIVGRTTPPCQSLCVTFHEKLIVALARWGITARLCAEQGDNAPMPPPPFLCFQRHSGGDVLFKEEKICGSAQRRRRGALLQHGSVILERSNKAPEIEGIEELASQTLFSGDLASAWCEQLSLGLGLCFEVGQLTLAEKAAVGNFRTQRYSAAEWTMRR